MRIASSSCASYCPMMTEVKLLSGQQQLHTQAVNNLKHLLVSRGPAERQRKSRGQSFHYFSALRPIT
jgi:hypothetical protein